MLLPIIFLTALCPSCAVEIHSFAAQRLLDVALDLRRRTPTMSAHVPVNPFAGKGALAVPSEASPAKLTVAATRA